MPGRYLIRRLLMLIWVVLGMTVLTFLISHVVPADPAAAIAGKDATIEQVEQIREELGLNRPLLLQYLSYMGGLVKGDLGRSLMTGRPVLGDILTYLPASMELALFSLMLAVPVGIILGVVSSRRAGGGVDAIIRLLTVGGAAIPVFVLALLLQYVFYGRLHWLPPVGRIASTVFAPPHITGFYVIDSIITGNWGALFSSLRHLILPAVTVALSNFLQIARMTRSSMLETLQQDYVRTARAKGLNERRVVYRHVLKNAMVPVITVIGMQLPATIAWLFLVESIFSWPGFGSYGVRAVLALDFPAIMGLTLFTSAIYVVVNLLVDLTYTLIDPRIEF